MNLAHLSNEELLVAIRGLMNQGRMVLARLLAYLGEVEERRLDLQSACSSLFDFCLRRLGMSEDEACRRVAAARLVRRFPAALGMIERGEIHLTGLLMLRDHLTAEGGEQLLRAAAGKSKGELQHLLAELFPRPDVPASIQPLTGSTAAGPPGHGPTGTVMSSGLHPTRSRIEPLAPARYRLEFTASAELKEKLERAADLMRHANPSGELSVLVERALDLLLAKLEKQRLAKVTHLRGGVLRPSTRRGYVPRAVRREVFERDGERCTFVDPSGRRCESRTWLELDHRVPRALRGADDVSNLSVRCRAHNRLSAEEQFGREHMDRKAAGRHFGRNTAGDKKSIRENETSENETGPNETGPNETGPNETGPNETSEKMNASQNETATIAASESGAAARRVSTGDACPPTPSWSETDAAADAASASWDNRPRQRGSDEDDRRRRCNDVAFRDLCGMGFRAQEARRALGTVEKRRAGSPPAPIETLLREALAVLAP
jgi:5-methylcytosine-specific restriction endonuclease McrA